MRPIVTSACRSRVRLPFVVLGSLAFLMAGCFSGLSGRRGASPGKLEDNQVQELARSLEALPVLNPDPNLQKATSPVETSNVMKLYYGSSYDPNLVDLVFFVDAREDFKNAPIHAAMLRGEHWKMALEREEPVWVVLFVATKPRDPENNCRFSAKVLHEILAPVRSGHEHGIGATIAALITISAKETELKSEDTETQFVFAECSPQQAQEPAKASDKKCDDKKCHDKKCDDKKCGDKKSDDKKRLTKLGEAPKHNPDMALYVATKKLTLKPGTNNRVVLNPSVSSSAYETKTRGAAYTFRDASHPYLRPSLGVGFRVDFVGSELSPGRTQTLGWEPDLYILGHLIWPLRATDWMLENEWYPSFFLGTNVLPRGFFSDLVFGVRLPGPATLSKLGVAFGANYTKYDFKFDPNCAKDCVTRSRHKWTGFLAMDYDL